MKRGAWFRFGKQTANQSADNRATDAEESRQYKTETLYARHNGACNQSDYEADNNVPNQV